MIGGQLMRGASGLVLLVGAGVVAYLVRDHLSTPWDHLFDPIGKRHGVDPNLLRAIGRKESGFRADAVSPQNPNGSRDYGVMQISSPNFTILGLTEQTALDPAKSIDAGARLLVMMKRELGDRYNYHAIISSYNQGTPRTLRSGILNAAYVGEVSYHHQLYTLGRMFS